MPNFYFKNLLYLLVLIIQFSVLAQPIIPLPEHPRPDFERANWQNLNGYWDFAFDKNEVGIADNWAAGNKIFDKKILVPFAWGSPLSEINDEADIAWYSKTITINPKWKGKRIFINIGASDWLTTVYIDGKQIGEHKGGYTPFAFEIKNTKFGKTQNLTIRVDDKRREFTLYGKQGYGNARGLWQTIYLEARPQNFLENIHFTPDIDNNTVNVTVFLDRPATKNYTIQLAIEGISSPFKSTIPAGKSEYSFYIAINNAHLWSLDDPYLYNVKVQVDKDLINTYFGMRKISTMNLPNTDYKYISLNNKPIYLQLALDQSYHQKGYYTFPTDEFMKNEIVLAKKIGLNGIRTHIKVDVPRKLYWADKLGLLVMSDLPNFWGQPDAVAKGESEYTIKEMIKRDYNHPAIFSWITFNETWGLKSTIEKDGKKQNVYLPETQKWVESVYKLAKSLDPSRLVEDNSICCGAGHTVTDINSWHEYLPGSGWEKNLKELDEKTFTGSAFHYEKGYIQTDVPNINSECGNVWGYEGSTGDVDWSWDYHRMINTFRLHPKIAGWLYTEHHDVINEWNGYYRFDRTEKETGFGDIAPGMKLNDLHSDIYVSTGNEISRSVKPNELITLPITISSMTDKVPNQKLKIKVSISGYDAIGRAKNWGIQEKTFDYTAWMQNAIEPFMLKMPNEKALVIASIVLENAAGNTLNHNFSTFIVEANQPKEIELQNGSFGKLLSFDPKNFTDSKWTKKQWNVLDGLKVNGAGAGYFEYIVKIPSDIKISESTQIDFVAELSAKQLFAKDMEKKLIGNEDYMLGAKAEPSQNPNAYPMTDESRFPTDVQFIFNGIISKTIILPNDPADSRGILSWHYQIPDKKLREAGSYGYLTTVSIPKDAIEIAKKSGEIKIRLAVSEKQAGGLAIFSDHFGKYPVNPTLIFYDK